MKRKTSFLIKTVLVLFLFTIIAPATYAQRVWGSDKVWTGKETKEEAWRKKIDIDMSVPDFKTKKIDQQVMGWRLAKMIAFIQNNYTQASYNIGISSIRYEQTEDPTIRFASTDKIEFFEAEKRDSIILIKWHTYTKLKNKKKVNYDIVMRFVNGVSNSETVNSLFSDISRFIKPDEEEK